VPINRRRVIAGRADEAAVIGACASLKAPSASLPFSLTILAKLFLTI
jgi:hypothetical protein